MQLNLRLLLTKGSFPRLPFVNEKEWIIINQPKIEMIRVLYFSATGTTKKVTLELAEQLSTSLKIPVTYFDFTSIDSREQFQNFNANELVIIGTPVYAGRVPNVLLPYLTQKLQGNNTLAIPVVLYGNRNYDDALIELKKILEGNGFIPIAAAAMVGEHAFSTVLAADRPDTDDLKKLVSFAQHITDKILTQPALSPVFVSGNDPIRPYYTPRDHLGNPVNILKVKPVTDTVRCIQCGYCVRLCPMGSINPQNVTEISGICIKCCACVKKCPCGAKFFIDKNYLYHQHELEAEFSRRSEPEFFL